MVGRERPKACGEAEISNMENRMKPSFTEKAMGSYKPANRVPEREVRIVKTIGSTKPYGERGVDEKRPDYSGLAVVLTLLPGTPGPRQ